jgi:hypothetical protein
MLYLEHANNVHDMRTQGSIVNYLHHACFSPVKSNWLKAINAGYFATWSSLTASLVTKHLQNWPPPPKAIYVRSAKTFAGHNHVARHSTRIPQNLRESNHMARKYTRTPQNHQES